MHPIFLPLPHTPPYKSQSNHNPFPPFTALQCVYDGYNLTSSLSSFFLSQKWYKKNVVDQHQLSITHFSAENINT